RLAAGEPIGRVDPGLEGARSVADRQALGVPAIAQHSVAVRDRSTLEAKAGRGIAIHGEGARLAQSGRDQILTVPVVAGRVRRHRAARVTEAVEVGRAVAHDRRGVRARVVGDGDGARYGRRAGAEVVDRTYASTVVG